MQAKAKSAADARSKGKARVAEAREQAANARTELPELQARSEELAADLEAAARHLAELQDSIKEEVRCQPRTTLVCDLSRFTWTSSLHAGASACTARSGGDCAAADCGGASGRMHAWVGGCVVEACRARDRRAGCGECEAVAEGGRGGR